MQLYNGATLPTPPSTGFSGTLFIKVTQNEPSDPKGPENIIYTMMMYGETFYCRHKAQDYQLVGAKFLYFSKYAFCGCIKSMDFYLNYNTNLIIILSATC